MPYRPPLRTPTPAHSSTSPPPAPRGDSPPKRKRAESAGSSNPALRIDTSQAYEVSQDREADSPRTKVAQQLSRLELLSSREAALDQPLTAQPKRLKRSKVLRRATPHHEHHAGRSSASVTSRLPVVEGRAESPVEIGETPDCRMRVDSSAIRFVPVDSPERTRGAGYAPVLSPPVVEMVDSPDPFQTVGHLSSASLSHVGDKRARLVSPPPPTLPASTLRSISTTDEQSTSPSTLDKDPPDLDQEALTWHGNEITGHDIDPTSADDDDGLGINGIGFRPTPAMASIRSQKRKQQVNEWRAREAREARQKRFDRRRGACDGKSGLVRKRAVRFEGVGSVGSSSFET